MVDNCDCAGYNCSTAPRPRMEEESGKDSDPMSATPYRMVPPCTHVTMHQGKGFFKVDTWRCAIILQQHTAGPHLKDPVPPTPTPTPPRKPYLQLLRERVQPPNSRLLVTLNLGLRQFHSTDLI